MSHLNFWILVFPTNFCLIKIDLSGNTVSSDFQKHAKLTIFGIFNELLSTQNVNIARFARKFECDILSDFQTMCLKQDLVYATLQKLSHLRVKWGIEHLHLNFHPQLTSLLWVSIFALLAFQFPDYFLSRFSRAIKILTAISSATKPRCLKITE